MATTKKTETGKTAAAAKTTAAKTTAAEKKPAAEKKTAAKKPAVKKTAPKKPAAKKAAEKVEVFIDYGPNPVAVDEVIKNVKATYGKDAKEIKIYVKPEESKAYYVADGEEGSMDVFFC